MVGPATYRALRDATYQLGARPLAYLVSSPVTGDDVLTLQERLLELGYDAGRANGVFGAQTEAALRNFQRDYGLSVDGICGAGDRARAAPAVPARPRRLAGAAARAGAGAQGRPAAAWQADRHRPGPRRRRTPA